MITKDNLEILLSILLILFVIVVVLWANTTKHLNHHSGTYLLRKYLGKHQFDKILANSNRKELNKEYDSPLDALYQAFSWKDSPEGELYWKLTYQQLKETYNH